MTQPINAFCWIVSISNNGLIGFGRLITLFVDADFRRFLDDFLDLCRLVEVFAVLRRLRLLELFDELLESDELLDSDDDRRRVRRFLR